MAPASERVAFRPLTLGPILLHRMHEAPSEVTLYACPRCGTVQADGSGVLARDAGG